MLLGAKTKYIGEREEIKEEDEPLFHSYFAPLALCLKKS
jgi:hypothetical protein